MKFLVYIAIVFLIVLFLSSCGFDINIGNFGTGKKGNGKIVIETRKVLEPFTEVSVSEGLMVYITQARNFNIEVQADENIINLIATDIKNGKLQIHAHENIGKATKTVRISLPEIRTLNGTSGSHLQTENNIKTKYLKIDGSSGALLQIETTTSDLEINSSSGANLNISGDADRTVVYASSNGNINAKELQTKICEAVATSGGNVKIQVSQSLTTNASSGGNISYSGEADVQKKKSISGSVHKY